MVQAPVGPVGGFFFTYSINVELDQHHAHKPTDKSLLIVILCVQHVKFFFSFKLSLNAFLMPICLTSPHEVSGEKLRFCFSLFPFNS